MLDSTFNPVEERPPWLATSSRRIGRYVLGPSLGRGGMGEVFAAWDTLLGRLVALKLILGGGATGLLRFMQEARLQARVDHPNVCRVLDVDIEGDQPFISMQIVKGPSLSQVQLEPREILAVMRQVADAVHAAHRLNLIHRDLKPGNILLERNAAEGWTPFVCDFGLAKDLGADSLAVSQAGVGTPAFMSPEQLFLNGAEVHAASDVYGLGATLLHALAGNPPPRRGLPEEGLAIPDGLPKDLQAILKRSLSWDPEDRYPTAAALAEDLRKYLDGEPISHDHAGWLRHWRQSLRRSPKMWAMMAALALACGALGTAVWNVRREASARERFAERFTALVKTMEYDMRIERMLPAHDLRPAFQRITSKMDGIREAIRTGGGMAEGPGHYALGQGYLLLRQPQKALAELLVGWESGFQTPEMAYAVARAHCDIFEDELPQARALGPQAIDGLKRAHLEPARRLQASARDNGLEPPALGLARLEVLDGHPDLALALAQQAHREEPSHYEAKAWEAEALNVLGWQRLARDDFAASEQYFRQSDEAARIAESMGRSDEWALKVQLNRWLAWIGAQPQVRPEDFRRSGQLAERLLALNSDWLPALSDKLTVIWRHAEFQQRRGQDPMPEVLRGWTLLEEATRRPEARARLQRDRNNLARIAAQWAFDHHRDPSPWVERGLVDSRDDEYAADLLLLRASWKRAHGLDPTSDLDRAIQGCERPSFEPATAAGLLEAIGQAWLEKAFWQRSNQKDPGPALREARTFLDRAQAVKPQSRSIAANLRRLAKAEREQGPH